MKDYVVKELVANNEKKYFPQEPFDCFDPYVEYFLLEKERKRVYIVRKIADKIFIIDLIFATPTTEVIDEEDFIKTYLGKQNFIFVKIPHYDGGCDEALKYDCEINKARKHFFQWLIDEGYLG